MIGICRLFHCPALLTLTVFALWFSLPAAGAQNAAATPTETTSANDTDLAGEPVDVHCGIDGVYRASQWTLFRTLDPSAKISVVETLDGDGVRVRYQQAIGGERNVGYAVPGNDYGPLTIKDANNTLYEGRLAGRPIQPSMPWVVVFGDPLGVQEIGKNELLGKDASVAVSLIDDASECPDRSLGLSGVDLVIIGPGGLPVLRQLSAGQSRAIVDYVHRGGRLLLHLGGEARALYDAAPWLNELVAVEPAVAPVQLDPAAIETYMSSQTRLSPLAGAMLPSKGGKALINGRTTNRVPNRLAVEWNVGFGRVTVAAMALDSAAIAKWPQRDALVNRLCGNLFGSEGETRRDAKDNSAVGYNDFAGQIRAALDRFELRRRVPYSVVSLILLAMAAMIGPIDYLVVNRLIGRPLFGWITFPVTVLAFAGLVLFASGRLSSGAGTQSEMSPAYINRLDIVDVDLSGTVPRGRGWAWSHLHGMQAQQIDYDIKLNPAWSESEVEQPTTAPFGYPGATFGGISVAGEDTSTPAYAVQLVDGQDWQMGTKVTGVPLPPNGSKGLVSTWEFKPRIVGQTELRRKRGSELLEGSIANPFDVDIYNGALVFGEWVYLLPSRFRPGQSIQDIESLRQKNFRWLLARREALENSSRSEPWNPTMFDDTQRMAELLMFSDIAGGREYTGLGNRPLKFLDLGYLLGPQQAILFGQVKQSPFETSLPVERISTSAVRVIFNVEMPRLSVTSTNAAMDSLSAQRFLNPFARTLFESDPL